MPNQYRQFHKEAIAPPDPPDQDRVIHSEVSHHFTSFSPTSWLGELIPTNLISDTITQSLEHAF